MFASTQDFIMISVIKKHYAGKSLLSRDLITREENHEVLFFFPSSEEPYRYWLIY